MLRYLLIVFLATATVFWETSAGFAQARVPAQVAAAKRFVSPTPPGSAGSGMTYEEVKREANDIAVSIVVSGLSCTCARFAEDIRNVLNDLRPGGIRVLPMLGVGGLQNLKDVLFLRNTDMAVVDQDNLLLLKQRDPKLYANIEQRVQYITKLYTAEFHVLATNDIKSYDDLKNTKVNFNLKDSQTDVTADRIFNMLNIPVERSYYDNDEAIEKLLKHEISAMIVLTGGPQAALAKLRTQDGVHFLPLDQDSLPGYNLSAIRAEYMSIELTNKLYPNLIPEGTSVPTIANHALLVSYAWPENSEKYRRIERFVNEFFGKVDKFKDNSARHPKWAEFSVWTDIPGWTRFKPAANWLAASETVSASNDPGDAKQGDAKPGDVKQIVGKLLEDFQTATGRKAISASEKEFIIREVVKQIRGKQTAISVNR
jgi:TRAP-type uncharacterized transport system substrate-binding protein